jgi:hypothetical protein
LWRKNVSSVYLFRKIERPITELACEEKCYVNAGLTTTIKRGERVVIMKDHLKA